MKTEQETSLDTFSISILNSNNDPNHLRCISNQQAVQMCVNKKCTSKNVFQCFDQACKCQEIHVICIKASYKPVNSMINHKINIAGPLKQAITLVIAKIIDELSLLEESLHLKLDEGLVNGQVSELEQGFQSLLKGQINLESFSSQDAEKLWNKATQEVMPVNQTLGKFNACLKIFQGEIEKSMTGFREKVNKLEQANLLFKVMQSDIMKQSAICTTSQLSSALLSIFSKKIKKLEYLFCASQNEYSMKKYYQVCGKVASTVIVCKTNMDKVIGAYTPLIMDQEISGNYLDTSGESFLFSLTNKQKFNLKDKQKSFAIKKDKDKSAINFGVGQFYLADKSKQNTACQSTVNRSHYYCPAYSVNDKAAYLKFHGNESMYFSTKQWEVWKVQFAQ